jgi:hypothetical protein
MLRKLAHSTDFEASECCASGARTLNPDSAVKTVERSPEAESWSNEGVRHLNFKVILRRALHRYQAAIRIIVCLEALTHRLHYGRVSPRVLCQTQLRNRG